MVRIVVRVRDMVMIRVAYYTHIFYFVISI